MNTKRKLIFSILMIFVLCLSASAIYAAEDDDANIAESQDDNIKIAESQDYDAISASDVENIETETVDNEVGELSSPAESEILSDAIDTSTATVEVVNGTEYRRGKVILDFSDIYDEDYSLYSGDTILTINEETVYGENEYYDSDKEYVVYDKYVFNMPYLDLGNYKFTINYAGNEYYAASTFTGTYFVNEFQKIDTSTATVEVVNGTKDNNGMVLIDFKGIYAEDYSLYSEDTYININEETLTGEVWDDYSWSHPNRYLFRIHELDQGAYPFTIHYGGNEYYAASDFTGTLYVTKIPLYIDVRPQPSKEGNNGKIEVLICDHVPLINLDDGEPYLRYDIQNATIIVNGKEYKFDVQASNFIDEGTFVTIDSLPGGNYSVSFKFAGDENYMAVEEFVADEQFSVISKDNKANMGEFYLNVENAFTGYNGTITYENYGKIRGIEMNGNLKIILVDENENEYEYLAEVDEKGEGFIDLGWNLTSGTYTIKVQYLGNDYYNPSELTEAKDNDGEPVFLKIYDENDKKIIYLDLNYSDGFLKGQNTTFNVSIDEYYQICDIPFTGKVKIILTNYDDEDDVFEYIMELDENGNGSIDLGYELTGSSYSINVKYLDDPVYSYESEYSIGTLNIYSEDNKAELNIYDVNSIAKPTFKGENGTITLNFTNAKKGSIPFVDGKVCLMLSADDEEFLYELDIIDDIATVNLGYNLTYNEYSVYIRNLESAYYVYNDDYGAYMNVFNIYDEEHKAPVYFEMSDVNDTMEGRNITINVDTSNSKVSGKFLTGNVKLILIGSDDNKYEYLIDIDEDGYGSIDLGYNLTCGEYKLDAIYLGNDYYKESEHEEYLGYFHIYGEDYKADIGPCLNYSFSDIHEGDNTTITLDLSPYKIMDLILAGTLNITLVNNKNENEYYYLNDYVVDDSGKCIFELGEDLPIGEYYFLISYSGNKYYNADSFKLCEASYYYFDDGEVDVDWETVYIYVVENTIVPKTATSISASNVNINANPNSGYFKVTLKSNGAALAGQNVTITFNGKTYKATTDKNGVATFKLSSGVAKKYPVTISFAGSDKYLSSTAKAYVTIKKNNVKFSKATKKVKKSKAKKAKFKITLKTSNNKVLAKKLVYIKINKKTYKAKTNAKGVATFKLKLPKKKKTYKYKVTFKGDKANNKKTFSKKLTVK